MKDVCISLSSGGKITDIESTSDSFIRFKNGYQICWGLGLWDQMDHPGTGGSTGGGDGDLDGGIMGNGSGHKSGDGTQSTSSYGDNSNTVCGGTKAITFPVPFNMIPYIVISSASANSYQTSNSETQNPPAAWYHDESMTSFTAELSSAVKFTWIAIGTWK